MFDYYKVKRISNSFLSAYKRELQGKAPLKATEALNFGNGFHKLLLEPAKFQNTDFTGKERIQLMSMVKATKEVVPKEVFNDKKEWEFYYNYLGYRCKLKADIVNRNLIVKLVGDFKTTRYDDNAEFMAQAIEFDYMRQAAWYLDCPLIKRQGIHAFTIWGVSKIKPYCVFEYSLHRDSEAIQAGREDYMQILEIFSKNKTAEQYKATYELP